MTEIAHSIETRRRRANLVEEATGLLIGAGFTLALVAGMAHFGNKAPAPPPVEFDDLRALAMPLDPPPPPVEQHAEPVESASPLTGIEAGASDSPVKIAVVPPDIEALFPATTVPPSATIQPMRLYSDLKPKTDLLGDLQHVFQQSEVDQIPKVLMRPDPEIPRDVRRNAQKLRTSFVFVVNVNGSVVDVRVLKTSGNPDFDAIIAKSMMEDWVFTPAIKRGKKVRCLMQEAVSVRWPSASPFNL